MDDASAKHIIVEPLALTDYYTMIRSQIEHEDNLMGTRLNWFITSQSFFFTAYVIDVTNLKATPPTSWNDMTDTRLLLRVLLPVIAIAASVVITFSVASGVMAMHNLRRIFRQHLNKARPYDLPPIHGLRSTRCLGLAAPVFLPAVFLAVWVFLLMQAH